MAQRTCSVGGCGTKVRARGWCSKHYRRWHEYGDPLGVAPPRPQRQCSVDDCIRRVSAKGYCMMHYARWNRHGDPMVVIVRPPKDPAATCSEPDCDGKQWARGWCRTHYTRWQRRRPEGPRCSVDGCTDGAIAKGWCPKHYQVARNHGDPTAKIGKGYRKGGRTKAAAEEMRRLGIWHCQGCDRVLPSDYFYSLKSGSKAGRINSACKLCRRLAMHHITYAEYGQRVAQQGGRCAIDGCTGSPDVIDHDHNCCPGGYSCGACIRGLLCNPHNMGLGQFKEHPASIRAAADYVERYATDHTKHSDEAPEPGGPLLLM